MFDIHPVVWLQSWASPSLTAVMNGISLLGYTRACVAIAVLLACAFRVRPAIALLVLIGLNGAFTDIAKAAAETPRPDSVPGVQALSMYTKDLREREADTPTEVEDSYGFPSGHVSATTTFAVGLAVLLRYGRRGWAAVAVWIALMALSRLYLGRHCRAAGRIRDSQARRARARAPRAPIIAGTSCHDRRHRPCGRGTARRTA
jgi:membrane-associated phospholipid phosphatase